MIHPTGLSTLSMLGRSINRVKTAIRIALLAIVAVALVFAGEFFFSRADVGALVAAIILGIGSLIHWSGRPEESLLWIRGKIFDSVWRVAKYF